MGTGAAALLAKGACITYSQVMNICKPTFFASYLSNVLLGSLLLRPARKQS